MKWKYGRQKDSYYIRVSVRDCGEIFNRIHDGRKVPKKFMKTLLSIMQDFSAKNNLFIKKHGRQFNTNIDIKTGKQI
jgi:hypothetical protein